MKRRCSRQCPCCRARALTLIEVVAGLAILGTLLVAVLLTDARCRRQSGLARRRMDAVRAADALLAKWWTDPGKFPRTAHGQLHPGSELAWRTLVIENEEIEQLGGQVVRLEVFRPREAWREKPTVTVDVVLPTQNDQRGQGLHTD